MKKTLLFLLLTCGFANAQIINIPDANFKARLVNSTPSSYTAYVGNTMVAIDTNNDNEIQVSEAAIITMLRVENGSISNLQGIEYFTSLQELRCKNNLLSTLNLTPLGALTNVDVDENQLTAINLSGLSSLIGLSARSNNLTSVNLNGCILLQALTLTYNNLQQIDLSGLASLKYLTIMNNNLTSLDVTDCPNLIHLICRENQIATLDITQNPDLQDLRANNNMITAIDASNCPELYRLYIHENQLTSLNISNCVSLQEVTAQNNPLVNLTVENCPILSWLELGDTLLTSLNIDNLPGLEMLSCHNANLTSITLTGCPFLQNLYLASNQLTTIDISNCPLIEDFWIDYNPLISLFIKNGMPTFFFTEDFDVIPPTLQYICADDLEIANIEAILLFNGISGVVVNSYCSFVPGGNYNTITGSIAFDSDGNGCDVTAIPMNQIPLLVTDATSSNYVTAYNGVYNAYLGIGDFTVTPLIQNPSYFTISPANATVSFLDINNNVASQNFCITPNGIHPDLEIVILPTGQLQPGFDAGYYIVATNKGNQAATGSFTFTFNDAVADFLNSNPAPSIQAGGILSFNYSNLLPSQTQIVSLQLNLNPPTATPPLNIGDTFYVSAVIDPVSGDETPDDNQFNLYQTIVGSFDPNNKVCLEGNTVAPTQIGDYLHYIINFENTGNFAATNVVIKDVIDISKFEMASLQLIHASHPMQAVITGNKAEFIFENILLEPNALGSVAFKIKTKTTLVTGDTVTNKANIFFDYNYPIETNLANTTFQSLSVNDNIIDDSISVYPNPVKEMVNIHSIDKINSVSLYDVQGRLLFVNLANGNTAELNLASNANGIYFLKIKTQSGTKTEKIIKE